MSDDNTPHRSRITPEEALAYHLEPRPGKYDIVASTPMATQRDLSLAYSPGVAVPFRVGWLSLVGVPLTTEPVTVPTLSTSVPRAGAAGGVRSIFTVASGDWPLVWPSTVAVTLKLWLPSLKAVATGNDQAPVVASAVTVPSGVVLPSR